MHLLDACGDLHDAILWCRLGNEKRQNERRYFPSAWCDVVVGRGGRAAAGVCSRGDDGYDHGRSVRVIASVV